MQPQPQSSTNVLAGQGAMTAVQSGGVVPKYFLFGFAPASQIGGSASAHAMSVQPHWPSAHVHVLQSM
jgi:hypothetical protein